MKVLIVDDSQTDLNQIKQIVERAGHQVITARDGAEGVELARINMPHLIFMDIVMPVMDGFRATWEISHDPQTSHIPIVLVSTKNNSFDVTWAKKQGAVTLIAKPYSPASILEQLLIYRDQPRPPVYSHVP